MDKEVLDKIETLSSAVKHYNVDKDITSDEFEYLLEKFKALTFPDCLKHFEVDRDINLDEFQFFVEKFGMKERFWIPEIQPNPRYVGNEQSRTGFKWNPYKHIKGKYYQQITKKAILAAIDMVHNHTLEKYDGNQFVYDDIFLIEMDSFTKAYIDTHFGDVAHYKRPFMHKIVDIVNGTISKEDVFYRAAYKDFINQLIKTYPKGFPLTEAEKIILKKWHLEKV